VLAHGDLADDNNVIVCADGTVKLIDWECAGFLPLHVARAVSETLDVTSRLGAMIGSLCDAAQSGTFGERKVHNNFSGVRSPYIIYGITVCSGIS
jgi:hypothetical protein